MKIEVSNGEIIDKITILMIKAKKITDADKLNNINNELNELQPLLDTIGIHYGHVLFDELYEINCKLWDVEDVLREYERNAKFDDEFIANARQVYYLNDKRSEIKRNINLFTNSNFIEEKSYSKYS
jgi:predicted nuclease with TOPRIM domain